MFNAIDSDDYTFKFTEDLTRVNDKMLNASLNRIKEIMTNAKLRAIEREKYYELIMNSVKTGIITIDSRGNVYQVNNEAKRMLAMEVFTQVSQITRTYPALANALKEIRAGSKLTVSTASEQGERQFSIGASEIEYDHKSLKIIALNDIADPMEAKESESWIRLTRILTHEIMNSLAPITSLSETLIGINNQKDDDITRGLETINATSRSLTAFVESYRKFTRISQPVCQAVPIAELLRKNAALICNDRVVWTIDCRPEDTLVWCDENMVAQVVVNILKNCVEALDTTDNPTVAITVSIAADQSVAIEIADNGQAIDQSIADNIFLPFYTTKSNGSGVGLSIARQIMHLHGGSLRLTSNRTGHVAFTLTFN